MLLQKKFRKFYLKFDKNLRDALETTLLIWVPYRLFTAIIAFGVELFVPSTRELGGPISMQIFEVAFRTKGWLRLWLAPWYRWDTAWYILIAKEGYKVSPETIIFPPVYPILIRVFAPFFGNDFLIASLFVSNLAGILFLIVLHIVVQTERNFEIARRTLLLIICFPVGFILVAGYSESVYLALAIGALALLRKKRYLLSGILGLFATLTRSQGWILGIAFYFLLLFEAFTSSLNFQKKLKFLISGLPAILGPFIGEFIYVGGMQYLGLGNVAEVYRDAYWNVNLQMPWTTLSQAVQLLFSNKFELYDWINFLSFVVIILLAILVTRFMEPGYWIYTWLSVGFILVRGTQTFVFNGILRYTLSIFPLFIGLAIFLERPETAYRAMNMSYIILNFIFQVVLLSFFASWLWVS